MSINFKTQSTLHCGIIMDGNGRWAAARGLPRAAGHHAGVKTVRRVIEASPAAGVGTLTLFAFSSDNWRRPPAEVTGLMGLLARYLETEVQRVCAEGIRLEVIGRRDRLEAPLRESIARAECDTAGGTAMHLRIAIDYSGRDAILSAVRQSAEVSRESVDGVLGPPVDLLIRTGGEQRLSDFLLWECAYAELIFSRRMWPDFDSGDLAGAVREFHGRQRRFGAVPQAPPVRQEAWLD